MLLGKLFPPSGRGFADLPEKIVDPSRHECKENAGALRTHIHPGMPDASGNYNCRSNGCVENVIPALESEDAIKDLKNFLPILVEVSGGTAQGGHVGLYDGERPIDKCTVDANGHGLSRHCLEPFDYIATAKERASDKLKLIHCYNSN
jgi:hypothetical protein